MSRTRKLRRIRYPTDAGGNHPPGYPGTVSVRFPDPALSGDVIVGVDWSEQGCVWVTYLVPAD